MTKESYRILIAEDNIVNLKLINKILSKLNHMPHTAHNGMDVLSLLQQQRFDFILMDIQMPKMDGLETTRQIVATMEPATRPTIIAMTANAMKGDKEQCLEAGMDDYVSKPIIIKELEKKLDDWGEKRRGRLELQENHPSQLHQRHEPNHVISLERLALLHTLQPQQQALHHLFLLFFNQCREMMVKLCHASAAQDSNGILTCLHSLKGACLNYGAVQAAQLCEQLERQLMQDRNWHEIAHLLAQLETSLALTTQQITAWIQAQA